MKGLEYLQAYEGATFDQLPRSIKRRIDETELNINVIESGTPDEVMFNVFNRINTGGITLNSQEIRHALNPGQARGYLLDLATSKQFEAATDGSVSDDRMAARELALRFTAFMLVPATHYAGNDLDGFLNTTMDQINRLPSAQLGYLKDSFLIAMTRARSLFEDDAFRKRIHPGNPRSPINRALFEAWSVALAKLTDTEFTVLLNRATALKELFMARLKDSPFFLASISVSTGSKKRIIERFRVVDQIIQEALGA